MDTRTLVELGERVGLSGEELKEWMSEEEKRQRDERALERDAAKERDLLAVEREKIAAERASSERARAEAEERSLQLLSRKTRRCVMHGSALFVETAGRQRVRTFFARNTLKLVASTGRAKLQGFDKAAFPPFFRRFPHICRNHPRESEMPPKGRSALSPAVSDEPVVEVPSESSSPTKDWYRQKVEQSADEVLQLKKKVKTLQQSKRRLSKRCDASQNLIKELKEKNLLSEKGLEVFEASFSPEIQQLLARAHEKTNKMYPPRVTCIRTNTALLLRCSVRVCTV
ncbi:hypothetical protein MTO96_042478 [Rhipicephalus appendiculatus]